MVIEGRLGRGPKGLLNAKTSEPMCNDTCSLELFELPTHGAAYSALLIE